MELQNKVARAVCEVFPAGVSKKHTEDELNKIAVDLAKKIGGKVSVMITIDADYGNALVRCIDTVNQERATIPVVLESDPKSRVKKSA